MAIIQGQLERVKVQVISGTQGSKEPEGFMMRLMNVAENSIKCAERCSRNICYMSVQDGFIPVETINNSIDSLQRLNATEKTTGGIGDIEDTKTPSIDKTPIARHHYGFSALTSINGMWCCM